MANQTQPPTCCIPRTPWTFRVSFGILFLALHIHTQEPLELQTSALTEAIAETFEDSLVPESFLKV